MKLTGGTWAGLAVGAVAFAGGAWLLVRRNADQEDDVSSEDATTPDSPAALARDKGVSLDVYALARVIASEAGGQTWAAQVAVAWAVINYAKVRGKSVAAVVLGSASSFGPQGSGGRGYVSSSKAPTSAQLGLAMAIDRGEIADPTGGATNFDSPREQRREHDAGLVKKTPEEVAADRERSGLVAYDVDVDGADFRFWGPA
jgi:hypothetical protein